MQSFRVRVGLGAAVVLVLGALAVAALVGAVSAPSAVERIVSPGATAASTAGPAVPQGAAGGTALVHVSGAVRVPGVYMIMAGGRVLDAVAAASGFTEQADRAAINLARLVNDGEQLYVPAQGEMPTTGAGAGASARPGPAQRLNLNRATADELEDLPRVGPALAERIVQFREQNGPFRTVEDLRSVSGIGDQVFGELRDLVTI